MQIAALMPGLKLYPFFAVLFAFYMCFSPLTYAFVCFPSTRCCQLAAAGSSRHQIRERSWASNGVNFPNRQQTTTHPYDFKMSSTSASTDDQDGSTAKGKVLAEVKAMRAGAIKKELESIHKIGTSGIFEKEDLITKLVEARIANPQAAAQSAATSGPPSGVDVPEGGIFVPLNRFKPREGVLGEGVRLDDKDYFAISLKLNSLAGGREENFLIDTAATNSLLSTRAQARINAPATGAVASASAGTSLGMLGLKQVDLGDLSMGKEPIGKIFPVVMELPVPDTVAGILGLDFLQRYDISLDFGRDTAVFVAPFFGGLSGDAEMVEIPGKLLAPLNMFYLEVEVTHPTSSGGQPTKAKAIVDMGSAFSIMNWACAKAAGAELGGPGIVNTGQVISGATAPGQSYNAIAVHEGVFDLGRPGGGTVYRGGLRCCVGDAPAFAGVGLAGEPAMVLGLDFLAGNDGLDGRLGRGRGRVVLALQRQTMWIDK